MRGPLSLGYLLARASDTIADTEEVDVAVRIRCLAMFESALVDRDIRSQLMEALKEDFIDSQTNPKERVLLERLDEVFQWFDSSWEWVWQALQKLMHTILEGQTLDLERFSQTDGGQIASDVELMDYCYLVAGCVGEYWSEVGCQTDSSFSSLDRKELEERGIAFGEGLQLVNILRDLPEDMHNGRSYLPGVSKLDETHLMEEAQRWRDHARKLIQDGYIYAKSLRQKRSRIAVVLPAMLADKTLDLLDEADLEDWQNGVKVSRKTVRQCLIRALIGKY